MAKGFKINKVYGETPVNVVLYKNGEKITKMEINNRKFSSEKMGRAFLASEFKLSEEDINALLSEAGEEFEVESTPNTNAGKGAGKGTGKGKDKDKDKDKDDKKEVEPVQFTHAYKTGKTVLVVDGTETSTGRKKNFSAQIVDLVTKEVTEVAETAKAVEFFNTKYGITKAVAEKLTKKDNKFKLTSEEYDALKAKIEKPEELEDAGTLGSVAKPPKEPKAPRQPIEGYPKWVLRDPQDVNQYKLMQEANSAGYSAKLLETGRADRGHISVTFGEDMLWHVAINMSDKLKGTEDEKKINERIAVLEKGDATKNEALESPEKRYCIFLSKALAATFKLAFDEKKDVATPDKTLLTSTKRRQSVYNR